MISPRSECASAECDSDAPTLTREDAGGDAPLTLTQATHLWGKSVKSANGDIDAAMTIPSPTQDDDHLSLNGLEMRRMKLSHDKSHDLTMNKGPAANDGVDADYQVLATIGAGGMGTIHAVRQTCLDRRVALKNINVHMAEDGKRRHQFIAEAAVTSILNHPNIPAIIELGINEHGVPFYTMEEITGQPWSKILYGETYKSTSSKQQEWMDPMSRRSSTIIHRSVTTQMQTQMRCIVIRPTRPRTSTH